jgi:hypothetical protein
MIECASTKLRGTSMTKTLITAIAVFALAMAVVVGGWGIATVKAQNSTPLPLAPQGLTAANGPNPGTATLAWTAVPGVSSYRIGRLSDDDYQAYADTWLERFAYSDVTATSAFTLTGLIPGKKYYFIVGQNHSGGVAWSSWVELTPQAVASSSCPTSGATATPEPTATAATAAVDYDADDDGLIEVSNLSQLDAMRFDLDGDGATDDAAYVVAFPNAVAGKGCPAAGCTGYELITDLDFDTNGNGQADSGDNYWDVGKGWIPIWNDGEPFDHADNLPWVGYFDGNNHTISNLYVKRFFSNSGLFGVIGPGSRVERVGLLSANVQGSRNTGGLVGQNNGGAIGSSYVTGKITGGAWTGGLVGENNRGTVTGSYFVGTVSGSTGVGGLVGANRDGQIANSYATGRVSGDYSRVGGIVGQNFGNVVTSYATAHVAGPAVVSEVGGLLGYESEFSGTTSHSYWDTQTSRQSNSANGVGKTTAELQSPTDNTGIYAEWNPDYWDFGTTSQYPVLKYGGLDVVAQRP